MAELPRVIACEHRFQIAILEANAFNLFLADMHGAPPNREALFGRSVDEVRRRAQIAGQVRIGAHRFERRRGSKIAVLANQPIDGLVFAKFLG